MFRRFLTGRRGVCSPARACRGSGYSPLGRSKRFKQTVTVGQLLITASEPARSEAMRHLTEVLEDIKLSHPPKKAQVCELELLLQDLECTNVHVNALADVLIHLVSAGSNSQKVRAVISTIEVGKTTQGVRSVSHTAVSPLSRSCCRLGLTTSAWACTRRRTWLSVSPFPRVNRSWPVLWHSVAATKYSTW